MTHTATSKAGKAEKPHIPELNWSANDSSTIWTLLAEIEKSENYHILYGKKDVAEVSFSILSSCGCLTQLVHRIQVVKQRLPSMPGSPKLSSWNYSLLTPTQFATVSRASLKGKDFISCVGLLTPPVPASRISTLPSPGYSMWNPWNGGWIPWNGGWIPYLFQVDSIPFPDGFHTFSRWIPYFFQMDSILLPYGIQVE